MQIKISNEEEMASVVEKLTNELLKSASMIPDIKPIEDAPKSYSKQNIFNDVIFKEEVSRPQINNSSYQEDITKENDYLKEASSKLDELLNSANTYKDEIKPEEKIEAKEETKKDIFIFSYFLAPKYIENKILKREHKNDIV